MPATPKTILIIDDSPEDRQIYAYYLSSGYTVLEASLGQEGLAMIREGRPDCVLLDYCLPDTNGQEILNKLHGDGLLAHMAVILLTGHADVRVAVSAMRSGALDFLEKNAITGELLQRAISHATEKACLLRELDRQREWLRATLASIHNGVLATDRDTLITLMNRTAARLTGWEPEEAIGKPLEEVLLIAEDAPETDWHLRLIETLSGNFSPEEDNLCAWLTRRNGQTFPVEFSLAPIHDAAGLIAGMVVSLQDVTKRRQAEEKLLEAKLAAEVANRANRAKSQFLANMSHELRTPLNAVMGLAQVLEMGDLQDEQRDMVRHIHQGGLKLLNQINDLLDFVELEANQVEIAHRRFELNEVIDPATRQLVDLARNKGLALGIETHGVEGVWLGDPARLSQVLGILINNAIKFTDTGRITVTVSGKPKGLHFDIRDTGSGIPAELAERLFQPFTQADSSNTRRHGGSGLGLAISKQLVERMQGQIGLASTPGVGSRFWFDVPLDRPPHEAPPTPDQPDKAAGQRLAGLHVLVVDDSSVNRYLAQQILKREGAKSTLAQDGQQALERLQATADPFDAVLMDIQMPVMDGLEATRALRNDPRTRALPVIALTASVMEEDRKEAMAAGMNAFLTKPLELGLLIETLLRCCSHPAVSQD
ncbi:MAG: response regulator [Methylococcus sp.]